MQAAAAAVWLGGYLLCCSDNVWLRGRLPLPCSYRWRLLGWGCGRGLHLLGGGGGHGAPLLGSHLRSLLLLLMVLYHQC
jgi:hypothetical protein